MPPLAPPLLPLSFDCCKCGEKQFDVQCQVCKSRTSEHYRCPGCTTHRLWDCCKSKDHKGQFNDRPCSACQHQQCLKCKVCDVNHIPKWELERRKQEKKEMKKEKLDREKRDRERRGRQERRELKKGKREQHELWLDRALRSHPSSRERTIKRRVKRS